MLKYYFEGGPLFMGMLSILFLVILVLTVLAFISKDESKQASWMNYIKSLGLLAFVLGMLGQFIGLFGAFKAIESGMDISPELLAGGLRVSSITSIYGMIIFVIAYILWFVLDVLSKRNS
jgi:biopolymer transport protein ExbB/TolQ